MMKSLVCIFLIIICIPSNGYSQEANFEFGLHSVISKNTPFWIQSNEFGRIDGKGINTIGEFKSNVSYEINSLISIGSELNLVSRISDKSTFFAPLANASITAGKFQLIGGRFHFGRNQQLEELSTGSLTMSQNAVPIPRLLLKSDYISFPFTNDILRIKGTFAHGVVDGKRAVTKPYLHESSLYGKLQFPKFYVYLGLQRYAFWGGHSNNPTYGKLPNSLDDFFRIIFSKEGGSNAPALDQDYKLGDQFGNYDGGISWNTSKYKAEVYWQNFFEDKDGLTLKNYTDGLFGVAVKLKKSSILDSFVYEHIYSKDQSGPIAADGTRGGPGGQDNYYNHSVYLTGWSYYQRSVGTPFFSSSTGRPSNNFYFENNRVVVHHIGIGGSYSPNLYYSFKLSTSNNYGNYRDRDYANANGFSYEFSPPKRQTSMVALVVYSLKSDSRFSLLSKVALDRGSLYPNSIGLQLGLIYKPTSWN